MASLSRIRGNLKNSLTAHEKHLTNEDLNVFNLQKRVEKLDSAFDKYCEAYELNQDINDEDNIKLPEITIPEFSGDFCYQLNFRDTFESLIISISQLSDIAKLHYLLSAVQGEARTLIPNIPITATNFSVAWKL